MEFETSRFVAHGADLGVRTDDEALRDLLNELLAPLATTGSPATSIDVTTADDGRRYFIRTERGTSETSRAAVVPLVISVLNHEVIRRTTDRVLVHAAAAERDGVAVVLPAPMEAGKTTLVAGLVRRGWGYLSDESVAIDPDTLRVEAYPKPLSIDPGSWDVLADLKPADPHGFLSDQWQVPVTSIAGGALGRESVPRFLVAPSYNPEGVTVLEPIRRAEMLLVLGETAFAGGLPRSEAFPRLAGVARQSECYTLSVASLEAALDLLEHLVS